MNGSPAVGEYRLVGLTPALAQSNQNIDMIEVNAAYNGRTLEVTYETLPDYGDVQEYVTSRYERVVCANPLAKAYHPVYVGLYLNYGLAYGTTETVDETALKASVSDYINNFDLAEYLDLSSLLQHVRTNFPAIGTLYDPVTLAYTLLAPNGQMYEFQTKDIVTISPEYPGNRAYLTNGATLATPIEDASIDPSLSESDATRFKAANEKLFDQYATLGISDRTVRYMTQPDLIVVNKVG